LKLAAAHEDLVYGALQTAWKLRMEKNRTVRKPRASATQKKIAPKTGASHL
jgi:hypothetical protein